MAVIGKIRNKSGLLIAVIGIAMGLFVLGDLLGSGQGLFQQQETNVAEIKGKKISYMEFEGMVQKEIGSQNLDEAAREQVRQRVWNLLLQEKIMFEEYNSLGLSVSPEELFYAIKNTGPNSIMTQYFTNPQTGQVFEQFRDPVTGGLNSQRVINYIRQVLESDQAESWIPVERAVKMDRLESKYYNLIKAGLNPSTLQVNNQVADRNSVVSFNYVVKNYASIDDAEVEVKESDLKKFFSEHREEERFVQKESSRGIDYITFPVYPSENDVRAIEEELKDLKADFQKADDDTLFVNDYADTPFNVGYVKQSQLPVGFDSVMFFGPKDTVYGPYKENGFYNLTKVLREKISSDSVKARHILLATQNPADSNLLKDQLDSLRTAIQNGEDFGAVARKMSGDKASAQQDGDLGWFTEGRMVKPFNDACFNGEVGDMPIVVTQFGVHLIEITEKTKPTRKIQIATINREIRPSKATFDMVFNEASSFSINNNNLEAFRSAGSKYSIQTAGYIRENDKSLNNLPSPRPLIRWVYASEKGAVSEPFEMDDMFVVACLTSIRPEGLLPFEEVKDMIRAEVLNQKKADYIKAQIKESDDLNQIASILGESIQNVEEVSFGAFSIPGIGPEAELLGTVFTLQPNEVSDPIAGQRGVYVVQLSKLNQKQDFTAEMVTNDLQRGYQSRVDFETFNALKDYAKIKDNRAKFY